MTRTDKYYKAIQYYGIVPVLYVLQQCEREENYEECKAILDAINYLNRYYSYMSYSNNKIQHLPSCVTETAGYVLMPLFDFTDKLEKALDAEKGNHGFTSHTTQNN